MKYKIMKINKVINVANYCCRVDYDYVGEIENISDDYIISYADAHNFEDGEYIIEDATDKNNIRPISVLFYCHKDNELKSFVDVVENDFKVMDYIAHHPVSEAMLWKRIREVASSAGLVEKICDLINWETV